MISKETVLPDHFLEEQVSQPQNTLELQLTCAGIVWRPKGRKPQNENLKLMHSQKKGAPFSLQQIGDHIKGLLR